MVGSEDHKTVPEGTGEELWVRHQRVGLLRHQVEYCNDALQFGLSLCLDLVLDHSLNERHILSIKLLLHRHLLSKLLLLNTSLQLILVLQRLSFQLLLPSHALLVRLSLLLTHSFFLLHFLLVTLQLQLHCVLGLALAHFSLILHGFSAFFFFYLDMLNLEFFLMSFCLKLPRLFLGERNIKSRF